MFSIFGTESFKVKNKFLKLYICQIKRIIGVILKLADMLYKINSQD